MFVLRRRFDDIAAGHRAVVPLVPGFPRHQARGLAANPRSGENGFGPNLLTAERWPSSAAKALSR